MNERCSDCWHYKNNAIVRDYPNTDNEILGWRTCGIGNTIKRVSVHGCFTTKKPSGEE